jgi:phosphatidylglycerol:prolipoprotein diacylglycerol transferase
MVSSWQSLPLTLDPIALPIGSLPVTWYALMYIAGAVFASLYFVNVARRQGLLSDMPISIEIILTLLWGVLIGARLGYVVFYGGDEYLHEPWRIVSPYDFTRGEWTGIRGMSFHGGLIGGAFGLWMFTREAKREFFRFSDVLVQAVPLALFFGRIGNFLNQELLGRPTTVPWGMRFPAAPEVLLHPVTLYEAAAEGLFLFFLLLAARKLAPTPGRITALFLVAYAVVRYLAEDYRQLASTGTLWFGFLTVGQAFSFAMVILSLSVFLLSRKHVV